MSGANLTLKIDADAGKAVKALLNVEKAEKRLDAAVKVGNVTLKGRIDGETNLAKFLEKVQAGEEKAATAQQKRTSTNLSAQRSTALYTQFLAKENEEKRKAAGLAATLSSAEQTAWTSARKRLNEQRAATEKARVGADGLGGSMSAAFKRAGVAATAATAVVAGLSREFDNMMASADRAMKIGRGMKDLVAALPEGPEGEKLLSQITKTGAKYGLMPDQAAALAGPLMAAADKDGSGKLKGAELGGFKQNLAAGAMLRSMGVAEEDATNVILSGDNQGVGGLKTAGKLVYSAQASMRDPDVFSRSASAISQFADQDTAYAVATALSKGELNVGQIPTRVKDAQMVLSSAADKDEFNTKYGLAGLDEAGKIAKLQAAAKASGNVKGFTDQFRNVEGLDEGKATSMAMLIQQGELYNRTHAGLKTLEPGLASATVDKLRRSPITRTGMTQDINKAAAAALALEGPRSGRNRDAYEREQRLAGELLKYGGEQAVDPETGLPKPIDLTSMQGLGNSYDRLSGSAKGVAGGMEPFNTGAAVTPLPGTSLPVNAPDVFNNEGTSYAAWKKGRALSYLPNYESKRPDGEAGYESKRINDDPYFNNYESKRPGFRNSYEEKRINNDPYYDKWQSKIPGSSKGYEDKMPGGGNAADLVKVNQELTQALRENTAATTANSTSAKRSAGVGGAASNAEEKY